MKTKKEAVAKWGNRVFRCVDCGLWFPKNALGVEVYREHWGAPRG